jgi:DivIVA domain-containing protein
VDVPPNDTTEEPVELLVEQPVEAAADEPAPDRVSPEQLVTYLGRATFSTTLGRRGYHQGEVDAFLARLADDVRAGEPLADLVRRTKLTAVRLEDGYDTTQVDDFLAAVVDLDPHATTRPEIARTGMIAKLFG